MEAHVQGDVLNETISIENGAFIDGKIHRVENPLDESYSVPETPNASSYAQSAPAYNFDDTQLQLMIQQIRATKT